MKETDGVRPAFYGVSMDSLKYYKGPPCPTTLCPAGGLRPIRKGGSTDSLKFHAGRQCPTLIRPAGGHPPNGLTGIWEVAHSQGGRPAAVFFPLGYPFPYGPGRPAVGLLPPWMPPCRTGLILLRRGRKEPKNEMENGSNHGLMVRGGHGLCKVSPWPAMPYPSTPCEHATPETAVRPFQG
jgi:hypothetical protein